MKTTRREGAHMSKQAGDQSGVDELQIRSLIAARFESASVLFLCPIFSFVPEGSLADGEQGAALGLLHRPAPKPV